MTANGSRPQGDCAGDSRATEALRTLPALTVQGRLARLRERLDGLDVDAAVFASAANVRWLTGFTGSNATLVLKTSDETALLTDSRYGEQARAQLGEAGCAQVEVVVARDIAVAASEWLGCAMRVGLEDSVSWAHQRSWCQALADVSAAAGVEGAQLVALTGVVEELRTVKDDAELARIEAAAIVADEALRHCLHLLRPGVSEVSVQRALEDAVRSAGADGPAYPTIVASGPNSALPHAQPTPRRMEEGDLVIIDLGAAVDGYRSDMTRTFVLGDPTPQLERLLDAVTRSQAAGISLLRPGVAAQDVDNACRSVLEDAGLGEALLHGTGHGIGLEVHERPAISAGVQAVLECQTVLTVEPGVYVAGLGGVRFEDLLVVIDGGSRSLTTFPKSPLLSIPA